MTARSKRVLLWAASAAAFMNVLDGSAVNVVLPAILVELQADTGAGVWVILAYAGMLTSTVLLFGQLADRWGPRRLLAGGFLAFTIASLACGLAPTLQVLVAARLLQGIAGGALSATSLAIVGRYVPPEERGRAIALLTVSSAMGSLLGAPVGGLLAATAGWRWVFLLNVPIGLVACAGLLWARSAERPAEGAWRADLIGALLSTLGIIGLIHAVTSISEKGANPLSAVFEGLLALAVLRAFWAWEKRCSYPLLDLDLLSKASFRHANSANFFASGFVAGVSFLLPFYLRYVHNLSEFATGLSMLVFAVVYILVSPLAGRQADRLGGSRLSTGAALLGAISLFLFAALAGLPGLWVSLGALMMMGLSYGAYLTPNNRRILSLAPTDRQGAASGLLRLLFYLGQSLGVAAIESLFSFLVPGGGARVAQVEIARLIPAFQAGLVACGALMTICALFSYLSGRADAVAAERVALNCP